jgi:glycine betaine/proline transport system permease protein
MPDALCNFPAISDTIIREARKNIDDGFRGIVRAYGPSSTPWCSRCNGS